MSAPASRSVSFERRGRVLLNRRCRPSEKEPSLTPTALKEIILNGEARHYITPSSPSSKEVPHAPDNTPTSPPTTNVGVSSLTNLTAVTDALGALQMQQSENNTQANDPTLSPVTVVHSSSPQPDSEQEASNHFPTDEEEFLNMLPEAAREDLVVVVNEPNMANNNSGQALNANLYPPRSSSLSTSPARVRTARQSQQVRISMGSPRPRANTTPRVSPAKSYTEPRNLDIGMMGEEVEADLARALSRLEVVARLDSACNSQTNTSRNYTRRLDKVLSAPERIVKLATETRAYNGLESQEAGVLKKRVGDTEYILMHFLDHVAKRYPDDEELDILNQHYKRLVK